MVHPTLWASEDCSRSRALVVPTELAQNMIICVFCIAEIDKVDNKSFFMKLRSTASKCSKSKCRKV